MKDHFYRDSRFITVVLGLTSVAGTIFLVETIGFVSNVSSQPTKSVMEKALEYTVQSADEKKWVGVLRNDELAVTAPERILEAITELTTIARLRGIKSTETIQALVAFLDRDKSSLTRADVESYKPPGIIFEPHPVMPEERYPVVVALQHIGTSAQPVLMKVIERSEPDSVSSNNAIFLVKQLFREDFNKAADLLREKAEFAETEVGRQRLLAAGDRVARRVR